MDEKFILFLLGQTTETDFLESVRSIKAEENYHPVVAAWYYAGIKRLFAGDKPKAAEYFRKALDGGENVLFTSLAKRELNKLEK